MKLSNKVFRFQDGGPVPAEAPAPEETAAAPEQGAPAGEEEAMMAQIGQMAQEIIQQMGPEAAGMLAQAIMELLQGGQPVPAPEAQPTLQRRGGRLIRVN